MLTRLLPLHIGNNWEEIKPAILISMPPTVAVIPESLNNILESLIEGSMQAWTLHDPNEDGEDTIYAIGLTRIEEDKSSGTKNLLIFSLYAYQMVPKCLWLEGLAGFRVFARSQGCEKVIAYSLVPRVLEIANRLGANTDTRFIIWEV